MDQAAIDRLGAGAARCNYMFEDKVDAHTWTNARTGFPLELHIDTVSLLPRVQARPNLLHGAPTVDLPTIQYVNLDVRAYCWQDLCLSSRRSEAILASTRPIDELTPCRNALLPPARPENWDAMHLPCTRTVHTVANPHGRQQ